MKCPKCGSQNDPGSERCSFCGAPLSSGGRAEILQQGGGSKRRPPKWIPLALLALLLLVGAVFLIRSLTRDAKLSMVQQIYAAAEPYQNANGSVPKSERESAIQAVAEAARRQKGVVSVSVDEYGVYVETESGLNYVYCPSEEDTDLGSGPMEIISLQPFCSENLAIGGGYDLSAPDDVATDLAVNAGELWRFSPESNVDDTDVSLDRILTLGDFSVILWHGHGGYQSDLGYFLATTFPYYPGVEDRYGLTSEQCVICGEGCIGLRPAFFRDHFPDGAFDNAFIYLATCFSGKEQNMAAELINKGAAMVVVNSETITRSYNLDMMHLISESFLLGPNAPLSANALSRCGSSYSFHSAEAWTIDDSIILAQLRYGSCDPWRDTNPAEVFCYCRNDRLGASARDWLSAFPAVQQLRRSARLSLEGSYWQYRCGDSLACRPVVYLDADPYASAWDGSRYPWDYDGSALRFDNIDFAWDGEGFVSLQPYAPKDGSGEPIVYTLRPSSAEEFNAYPIYAAAENHPASGLADGVYYARIEALSENDQTAELTLLSPISFDEVFLSTLQPGDLVGSRDYRSVVSSVTDDGSRAEYRLEDGCTIRWEPGPGAWLLFSPSGSPVFYDLGGYSLPMVRGLLLRDENYAAQHGGAPDSCSATELTFRYGGDLSPYVFLLELRSSVITQGTLLYLP